MYLITAKSVYMRLYGHLRRLAIQISISVMIVISDMMVVPIAVKTV